MEKRKDKVKCSWMLFVLVVLFLPDGLPKAAIAKATGPDSPPSGITRGQTAIDALGEHLPGVAARYGKSAEKLTQLFLQNSDLWVDSAMNLLYACGVELPQEAGPPQTSEQTTANSIVPYDQTFSLHSLAGSSRVIHLDFDGHTTSGTPWNTNYNNGQDIISLPYDIDNDTSSFSDTELERIQNIWARVAEDFVIYNIDVTTEDPGVEALRKSSASDDYYGIRVVISPSSSWYGNAGGVAYVGSFDLSSDRPCFVFSDKLGNGGEKYVAEACSHEIGHTLGLYHDGITNGTQYYQGHGDWAPIMGNGYYRPITQWSKGEYDAANNQEDDLAIMLTQGARYLADDHGPDTATATPVLLGSGGIDATGIVEKSTDVDVFSFATGAGEISIVIDPTYFSPNLDIGADLYDSLGGLIVSSDPLGLAASLTTTLSAGTYYLHITGVGTGDPSTGYSDYASLGQYFIAGTVIDPGNQNPPTFMSEPVVEADATEDAAYTATIADDATDLDGDALIFSKVSGPAWLSVATDGVLTGTSANGNVGINSWTVQVADGRGGVDQATLQITVINTNDAPSFTNDPIIEADATMGSLYTGAIAGDATDPDAGDSLSFSAVSGPAWLAVSADGSLSGIPAAGDVGPNSWTVQVNDIIGETDQTTLRITVLDPDAPVDDVTNGDIPVRGSVAGNHTATQSSDNNYQAITEIESGGKPSKRRSYLEHEWTIDVTGGNKATFHVQAHRSANGEGDNFVFAYSTDNVTYSNMVTVTKDDDDDSYQTFALPAGTAGTVYIRVTDTDRTRGNRSLDTLYVDHIFIRSETSGDPDPVCTPASCHVQSILCGTAPGGKGQKYGRVTVTIHSDCGTPVQGASVSGDFTGDFNETVSGGVSTDANGQAVFTTLLSTKRPTYSFCVNGVQHAPTYEPLDNIVNCAGY